MPARRFERTSSGLLEGLRLPSQPSHSRRDIIGGSTVAQASTAQAHEARSFSGPFLKLSRWGAASEADERCGAAGESGALWTDRVRRQELQNARPDGRLAFLVAERAAV